MASSKNSKYWEKRFEQLETSQNKTGLKCYAEIEKQYQRAEHEIETKLRSWYQRFAANNEISLAEAHSWLKGKDLDEFKWTVQDYISAGEENALDGRWMKQLENASAKYHISRLESIELEMQQSLEMMFNNQLDSLDSTMRKVYSDGYYHTAFEIQKGWEVGWDFAQLDERKISKVINKPWAADGKNFSTRIWDNQEKLINELNNTLVQNIMLGQDPQKAIDAIAKRMDVSKRNAGRLVMTEEAYFSSVAQGDCFRELDVEQYQIVATLDNRTSEICQEMDGKVFKMSERQEGTTAPPFHPNCRSTTIPYFDEWYGLERERVARDENGNVYNVPADMTYKEWRNKFPVEDYASSDKIESGDRTRGISDNRNFAMGLRKPASHILTDDEITTLLEDADALGIDHSVLNFNKGNRTGFNDRKTIIDIRGDILPDTTSEIARDRMSQRAVLAHEYYGHYKHHPSEYPIGDWRDEFRASYRAAVDAPNLTDEDRAYLMIDAYDRAREAGEMLEYDETARRIIYGH